MDAQREEQDAEGRQQEQRPEEPPTEANHREHHEAKSGRKIRVPMKQTQKTIR